KVRLFSRTRDDITESFPELVPALAAMAEEVILDGEIVAWQRGRALPFQELQQRLGRKRVGDRLMHAVPVAYIAFDVLYAAGELAMDLPLRGRSRLLDEIFERA